MPKERIGIMGGSFNPIHDRHIEIAACAKREQKLDRVIFLPAGNPPHKHDGLADAENRYEMTRLAGRGICLLYTSQGPSIQKLRRLSAARSIRWAAARCSRFCVL